MQTIKNSFLLALLICFFSSLAMADDYPPRSRSFPNVIVTLRIDDVQSRISTYGQPWDKFRQAAEKHHANLNLAVIPHRLIEPQNNDGVLASQLKDAMKHGHQVIMHGYNHICPICQSSNHEFSCTSTENTLSIPERVEYLNKGISILQDKLGQKPGFYCGPGVDPDRESPQFDAITTAGFKYITEGTKDFPIIEKGIIQVPVSDDYTWGLTTATYQQAMDTCKSLFVTLTKQRPGYFGLCFHDPFVRDGYENGILAKFLDEFLTFVDQQTGNKAWYPTNDEAAKWYFDKSSKK